jgi:hypothetical protein
MRHIGEEKKATAAPLPIKRQGSNEDDSVQVQTC